MKFTGFTRLFPKPWAGRQWISVILLLSIIPVVFFGTILYGTGTRIVEDEVDRSSQHSIAQMKDQMDLLIHQIEQFTNQFSMQTNVAELLKIGDSPSVGSLPLSISLMNDLSAFSFTLQAVDSVYLYHFAQNTVIYSEGVASADSLPDTGWLEELNKHAETGKRSFWIAPRIMIKTGGSTGTTLTYVRILPYLMSDTKAALVINIKESYLRQLLQNFPLGSDGGVLVLNESNALITASGAYQNLMGEELDHIIDSLAGKNIRSTTTQLKHPRVFVTSTHSDKNGWTYAMLVPADAPVKSVQSLKRIILTSTAVLSLLALITSYFSFQRFQNGVRRILKALGRNDETGSDAADSIDTLFFDGKIDQIEQRIIHLMKENRDYKQKRLNESAVMRNNYLHSLLLGQIGAAEQAGSVSPSQLPASFIHSHYSLFVIEMDSIKPDQAFGENDEPLFLFAAANIAQELLNEITPAETVLIPKHTIVVLNIPEAYTERQLLQAAELLRETILKILKHSVTISVGGIIPTIRELPDAYNETFLLLQRRWLGDGNEVVVHGGTIRPEAPVGHYPLAWEDRLFRQIRAGDKDGAREALQHFYGELDAQNVPFSQLKTYCLQLLVSATRIFGYEPETMDVRKLYDEFMRLDTAGEIRKWLSTVLSEELPQSIQKLNKRQKDDIEGKVLRLIETRYGQDLSLQMAAEECGVSTSYLSELFKNSTGVTFIQYVTHFRVEKAKHMLLHTELTIAQIAEAVGYSNATQLIRVFKKTTGATPGEFRSAP